MAKTKIHVVTFNEGENGSFCTNVFASLSLEKVLRQAKKKAKDWTVEEDEDGEWTQSKYERAVGACKTITALRDLFNDVHAPFQTDDEPCMDYTVIND